MRLRCLVGAYAGQIRDYSTAVGLRALSTGMAERVDRPIRSAVAMTAAPAAHSAPKADSSPSRKRRR